MRDNLREPEPINYDYLRKLLRLLSDIIDYYEKLEYDPYDTFDAIRRIMGKEE